MCGKTPKTPQVVQRDPIAEQIAAENKATMETNQETAAKRVRRRGSSLLTAGAGGSSATAAPSLLAQTYGKATLGS